MHPLDTPVWTALADLQAQYAVSSGLAVRFPPEMTVLGALREPSREAYESLQPLARDHAVTLYFLAPPQHPPDWTIVRQVELFQMVHHEELEQDPAPAKSAGEVIELKESDVPDMSKVYAATRPGRTLCPRIQQLGTFLGVRCGGRLVAMGGLRLHLAGYREITTVGTLPGQTGRGHATAIVSALVQRIRDAGDRPFLTVRTDNTRAIQIYRRLGFKERSLLHSQTILFGK